MVGTVSTPGKTWRRLVFIFWWERTNGSLILECQVWCESLTISRIASYPTINKTRAKDQTKYAFFHHNAKKERAFLNDKKNKYKKIIIRRELNWGRVASAILHSLYFLRMFVTYFSFNKQVWETKILCHPTRSSQSWISLTSRIDTPIPGVHVGIKMKSSFQGRKPFLLVWVLKKRTMSTTFPSFF